MTAEISYKVYILTDPRRHIARTKRIRYVGQTKQDLNKRLYQHIIKCDSPSQKQRYVNSWIRKLLNAGVKPKIRKVASCVTREKVDNAERKYIQYLSKRGYRLTNLTSGGDGHFEMSEVTRKKMSDSHKGAKNHFYGRKHSEETKRKISEANKGKSSRLKGKKADSKMLDHLKRIQPLSNSPAAKQKQIRAVSKTYNFCNPQGQEVEITNLAKYCRENNLNVAAMNDLFHGVRHRKSYKGWRRMPPALMV